MHKNLIIVLPSHDYEDLVEGGYTNLHHVLFCDVGEKEAALTYDIVNFPKNLEAFGQCSPRPEARAFPGQGSHVEDVNNKKIVDDEVLLELRDRGVTVVILREKSHERSYENGCHPEMEEEEILFDYVTIESLSQMDPKLLVLMRKGSKIVGEIRLEEGRKKEEHFPIFVKI